MAIGTERGYLKLRLIAILILLLHLGVRLVFRNPSPFADLILFNTVAFLAAAVAFSAPLFNDQLAVLALGWAFVIWSALNMKLHHVICSPLSGSENLGHRHSLRKVSLQSSLSGVGGRVANAVSSSGSHPFGTSPNGLRKRI